MNLIQEAVSSRREIFSKENRRVGCVAWIVDSN